MKASFKELPLPEKGSFLIKTFHLKDFDQDWHYHTSNEIIWFIAGNGQAFIGNTACSFQTGDIFMLGSNLKHQFRLKTNMEMEAMSIYLREDCWGRDFLKIPECQSIKQLLNTVSIGLKLTGETRLQLQVLIKSIETALNINRIILLLQCLQTIATTNDHIVIWSPENTLLKKSNLDCIEKIFKYTNDMFRNPVTLPNAAAVACMSIPTFCNYFKRLTNKTYITYLNEVRVSYACQQLLQTSKAVTDICYESGFNTVAHFHRQFLRHKNTTPLQYRKTNQIQTFLYG